MVPPHRGMRPGLLLLCLVSLCGCPPDAKTARSAFPALAPSAPGSLTRIDVRRLPGRPGLTLVVREGDPAPAAALAVAAGLGAKASVALATLLEVRLGRAGHEVESHADHHGLRLVWWPAEADKLEDFIDAVALAFRTPVTEDAALGDQLTHRLAALEREPLDDPALLPIVRCTGELGTVARDPRAGAPSGVTIGELERWRRTALTATRAALAAVGPEDFTSAAEQAWEDVDDWPSGAPRATPAPTPETHGTYQSSAIAAGSVRLDLAARVRNPHQAVGAVTRLGTHPSPLTVKLAALQHPWQLERLSATALPAGGCISAVLSPLEPGGSPPAELAAAAANVTALLRAEFRHELSVAADPFTVPAQITTAADPRQAAQRAAWWSLAGPGPGADPQISTALGVSSLGSDEAGGAAAALAKRYPAEQARQGLLRDGPVAGRRLAVERGQGEVWALLASPCAVLHEGPNETGAMALAAVSAATAAPPTSGVKVEPWITPSGVGLLARGGLREAAEDPGALARRVGRTLGQAFATGPESHSAFLTARSRFTTTLDRGANRYVETLASKLSPEHPTWLLPLGALERQVAFDQSTILRRWRDMLRGPLRLAVIANADEQQAQALAGEVDRWLLPAARASRCTEQTQPTPVAAGTHRLGRAPPGPRYVFAGVRLPSASAEDRFLGQALAIALDGPNGGLARALHPTGLAASWSARWLGGDHAAALVITIESRPGRRSKLEAELVRELEGLRQRGLQPTRADWAARELLTERARMDLDPRRRITRLWHGHQPPPLAVPEHERWQTWLRAALAPSRIVVVTAPIEPAE